MFFLLILQLFCQSMSEFSGIQETLKHIESDSHLDSQLEYTISVTHNILVKSAFVSVIPVEITNC